MLAKRAAMRAHNSVDPTQNTRHHRSGIPPMAKWLTAPVKAVKVIMNTLVPTAVFSSYPSTLVRISSIIMPPPAPINPQIKPIITPQITDCTNRFLGSTASIAFLVVITGFTINLTPSRNVINTEKLPIVLLGTWLAIQLPTMVKHKTDTIITTPLRMSRFLFLP